MKVLVLTTSYPRGPGDTSGLFVRDAVDHVRATGVFIRYPDGTGVAEIFYLEHRKLRRHCVGQTFVEDQFEPIPFDEALRLDKQLIARLDQWVRRQAA